VFRLKAEVSLMLEKKAQDDNAQKTGRMPDHSFTINKGNLRD